MPTKEHPGGELYMLINGEYQKATFSPFIYQSIETTSTRKYSLFVRLKLRLGDIKRWFNTKLHRNQYTIEWFQRFEDAPTSAVIMKGEKQ